MLRITLILLVGLSIAPALAAAQGTGFDYETVVADGLDKPIDMAFVGDDLVVIGQCGAIYHIDASGSRILLADIGDRVNCQAVDAGLLALTVSPDEGEGGWLYVYFTAKGKIEQRVSRYPLTRNGDALELDAGAEQEVLWDLPWATNATRNSAGLALGTDGNLFIGVGDNGQEHKVQDAGTHHGKILRVDPAGGDAPGGNPEFGGKAGGQDGRLFAIGLGRPFRIAVDSETGHLWITDAAKIKYEEINRSVGGENFGWPTIEGVGHNGLGGELIEPAPTDPVYEYAPAAGAPALLIVGAPYRPPEGASDAAPQNFIGAVPMADYYSNWVRVLQPAGDGWEVAYDNTPGPQSVRAIATGPDGAVYFVEYIQNSKAINSRLVWADDPPTVTIVSPAEGERYNGGQTLNLDGTATDPEEGAVTGGFEWSLTLYDGDDAVVDTAAVSGKTGQYTLPDAIDIHGRLEIELRAKDSVGSEGSATRTLDPEATQVTFGSDPEGVPVMVAGEELLEKTTITYVAGSKINITCPPETSFADDEELYVFDKWTGGGEREQEFVVPNADLDMICTYRVHGPPPVPDKDRNRVGDTGTFYAPEEQPASDDGGCQVAATPAAGGTAALLLFGMFLLVLRRRAGLATSVRTRSRR